jgi:hypothetical protein
MATYSYEQLKKAQEAAERAGNQEAAAELQREAMRMAKFSQGKDSGFVEDVANIGRGMRSGIGNTFDSARGLIARGMGNDDALKRTTQSKLRRAERDAEYKARSPIAFGSGKFLGETAATLPIGGAGGIAAKTTAKAIGGYATGRAVTEGTKKLATVGMAGEGAAIGATFADEGQDVSLQAGLGAAIDVGVGSVLTGISRPAGELYRRVKGQRKARKELTATETDAQERIDNARKYGGYHLDPLTASATREAHEVYQGLKNSDAGNTILNYEKDREIAIRGKVVSLINQFGDQNGYKLPGNNDPIPSTGEELRNVGNRIAESLTFARLGDEAKYKALYKEFDNLAKQTNVGVYTENMKIDLDVLSKQYQGQAYKEMHDKILKDFDKYGISGTFGRGSNFSPDQPAGTELRLTPRGGQEVAPVGAQPAEKVEKLTFENAERLIQDLNAYWRPDLSGQEKKMLYDYKKLIDDGLDRMLVNMDDTLGHEVGAVTEAGRAARRARREYSEEWETDDIIRNIVRTADAGLNPNATQLDDLFTAPDLVLNLSSNKMSPKALKTIKAKLLTVDGGQDVINSMQQAPLLEAMHSAITKKGQETAENGTIILNHQLFMNVINKIPRNTRNELWGKEFTDGLDKTMRAWADRWNRPTVRGSSNPSGTFIQFLRASRFFPTGKLRNVGMAAAAVQEQVSGMLGRRTRETLANQITDPNMGSMPTNVADEQVAGILDEWESQFRGANGTRYGDMLRTFARTGITLQVVD